MERLKHAVRAGGARSMVPRVRDGRRGQLRECLFDPQTPSENTLTKEEVGLLLLFRVPFRWLVREVGRLQR